MQVGKSFQETRTITLRSVMQPTCTCSVKQIIDTSNFVLFGIGLAGLALTNLYEHIRTVLVSQLLKTHLIAKELV